jgi:hypothetical protein
LAIQPAADASIMDTDQRERAMNASLEEMMKSSGSTCTSEEIAQAKAEFHALVLKHAPPKVKPPTPDQIYAYLNQQALVAGNLVGVSSSLVQVTNMFRANNEIGGAALNVLHSMGGIAPFYAPSSSNAQNMHAAMMHMQQASSSGASSAPFALPHANSSSSPYMMPLLTMPAAGMSHAHASQYAATGGIAVAVPLNPVQMNQVFSIANAVHQQQQQPQQLPTQQQAQQQQQHHPAQHQTQQQQRQEHYGAPYTGQGPGYPNQ